MTYGILEARDHDKIRELILNSKETTFVHKSIEKTQKFKYFWVFKWVCLQYAKAFAGFSA